MIRRRLAFATPFVLVAGCKAPAPASPRDDEQTRDEEAPVVVTLPPPIDAPPADAPDLHLEAAAGIRNVVEPSSYPLSRREICEERARRQRECCYNPPPPQDRTVRGRVIGATRERDATSVIVGLVAEECESMPRLDAKRWTAQLLRGDSDQPLDQGAISLVECNDRSCKGRTSISYDQLTANTRVLLTEKK